MEKLYVSIDPGFDSVKIVANGKPLKFPFNAVETDERKMSDYALRDDFMLYQESTSGATWRVGQYAREMIYDRKSDGDQMSQFYTEERFLSNEFVVGLRTAIALSIKELGLYDQQNALEIYLMITLPHSCRTKFAPSVSGAASGQHCFSLAVGTAKKEDYDFFIDESHVYTVSQTIAAILGETSDENGYICDEKYQYLSNGPTLVIDGGYYTTGLVKVSRGGSVNDDETESNTNFAMKNVNMAIAKELESVRSDIKHYMIEYMLSQHQYDIKYFADGKVQLLNLKELRQQKIRETALALLDHLNEKYNHLLDVNYILVTGGTGAKFYWYLKKAIVDSGVLDEDHVLLTSTAFKGQDLSVEYAIALGGYKGLRGVTGCC